MGSKTVAIIGARLSSKRLPGKQLLPLAGAPLIAHIVNRLRAVPQISEIIVATTDEPVNTPLCEWARSYGVTAFDWDGDQNDVVGRVDAAFKASGADRFVYICGDCPFIEPNTIANLIEASADVDPDGAVQLKPAENGQKYIHEGFDVFNRAFWDRMVAVAHEPFEREHVGAVYYHLNKMEPSEVRLVSEEAVFSEVDHRLSVDTQQDYAFATALYERWYKLNPASSIVDLKWIIDQLKSDEALVSLNAHVHQKTVLEVAPVVKILCEAGPGIGLGHLSRACVAAQSLQEHAGADVELLIKGAPTHYGPLTLIRHRWVEVFESEIRDADGVVVDVKEISRSLADELRAMAGSAYRIGVDVFEDSEELFDLLWGPTVYVDTEKLPHNVLSKLRYGADCFLLRRATRKSPADFHQTGRKSLIVLTGGADPARLSACLPDMLEQGLPPNIQVDWVQGPYADDPVLSLTSSRFNILKAPKDLHQVIAGYDLAFCVFGVTFFECLNAGTPVIAFDPIGAATAKEWAELNLLAPGLIAGNLSEALDLTLDAFAVDGMPVLPGMAGDLPSGPKNFAEAFMTGFKQIREASNAAA